MTRKLRLTAFALLIVVLSLVRLRNPDARANICDDIPVNECPAVMVEAMVGWLQLSGSEVPVRPTPFVPPEGAGEVIMPEGYSLDVCSVTPSTGEMSGVNVRSQPDFNATVIDGLPLNSYAEVAAIGDEWYAVITPRLLPGYVAKRVTTLVGPCGEVPPLE
ncbi:MAG: SH3 domain-containing protein [Chloroflexota bacterium]